MNSAVDSNCAAAHPTEPNLCMMAEHLAPFIQTPLFALEAEFGKHRKHECPLAVPPPKNSINTSSSITLY